ncbi:interleukin-10 [Megalops cyprinoides]|uniref:interleukin-10 n=1 Tax=Megalops cyprinoides TaxID=118141 RepID=UPI0018653CC1|nr:interleukin-10 [Megalops cyprinoides]
MALSRLILLSLLLTALLLETATCKKQHCSQCCSIVENFPARLRLLRESFSKIRNYYESKDDIETALLDEAVLNDFQTPFGCHAMNEVLRFYLDTVLPTAKNEDVSEEYRGPISNIGNIFYELKRDIVHCRNYFLCKKPFELDSIMSTYKEMQGQGLYKAMGELGMLFNYIEEYMVSKRRRN